MGCMISVETVNVCAILVYSQSSKGHAQGGMGVCQECHHGSIHSYIHMISRLFIWHWITNFRDPPFGRFTYCPAPRIPLLPIVLCLEMVPCDLLIHMCMCVCMCVHMWRPEENLHKSVLSSHHAHHVGSKDQIQVVRLGDRYFYNMSHFACLFLFYQHIKILYFSINV